MNRDTSCSCPISQCVNVRPQGIIRLGGKTGIFTGCWLEVVREMSVAGQWSYVFNF